MFIFENIRLALGSLITNKMRSLLTMLGIIIGISSVITITTIGNSMRSVIQTGFLANGDNGYYLLYSPRPDENGVYPSNVRYTDEDYISRDSLNKLETESEGRYMISSRFDLGTGTTKNSKNQSIGFDVEGISEGRSISMKYIYKLQDGRYINDSDSRNQKHSVMVSDLFVEQYFLDGSNPIGQTLQLDIFQKCTADFVIAGVYKLPSFYYKETPPGLPKNEMVTPLLIPYGTAVSLSGEKEKQLRYPQIVARDLDEDFEEGKAYLQEFFDKEMANSRLQVYVQSDMETMKIVTAIMDVITFVISLIAAISLLVGGIGVMNIMLVSITERTREIGIRKAIGAKPKTIRNQFVIEAIILCLIGGAIGIVLGLLGAVGLGSLGSMLLGMAYPEVSDILEIKVEPSAFAILLSLGFSCLVGIFFGSYPASKAAKLDPIEALRYE